MATAQNRLNQILPTWYDLLTQWSLDGSLVAAATEALLRDGINAKKDASGQLQSLVAQWSAGNFKTLPQIVLLSDADISGALGAYAPSTGKIYLNQDWLLTATDEWILRVLIEELGHYLDDQLCLADTTGDEGALFAALLQSSEAILQNAAAINLDNDQIEIGLAGEIVLAEASATQGWAVHISGSPDVTYSEGGTSGYIEYAYGATALSDGSSLVTGSFVGTISYGAAALSTVYHADIFVAKFNSDATLAWMIKAGGDLSDSGYSITALSDGSSLLAGSFIETGIFGTKTRNSKGQDDVFVAKLNADGTFAWVTGAGGIFSDVAYSVAALSDGSSLITGSFSSSATFGGTTLTTSGSTDVFIAKLNPNGTFAWATKAGGSSYDVGRSVTAMADGSALVLGKFSGTATFGNKTLVAGGTYDRDIFITKLNPNGTFAWTAQAGGIYSSEDGRSVVALADGSSLIAGSFHTAATFGNIVFSEPPGVYAFVAKLNTDGTFAWVAKVVSEHGGSSVSSITALSDGSSLITGSFRSIASFGATTLTAAGSADLFVAKLKPDGTFAWATKAGGISEDTANSISVHDDGSILITGTFIGSASFGSTLLVSNSLYQDIYVAKLNPNGTWGAVSTTESGNGVFSAITADNLFEEGVLLRAGTVSGDPDGDGSIIRYRWLKDGIPIFGAHSSTYLTDAVSSGIYTVQVDYQDAEGNYTTLSSANQAVARIDNGKALLSAITSSTPGLFQAGATLAAGTLSGDPEDLPTILGYQWYLNNIAIGGATSLTYKVNDKAGFGTYKVVVSYSDGQGYRSELDQSVVVYPLTGWPVTAGGLSTDISSYGDGSSIITGYFSGSVSLGVTPFTSNGGNDMYIARLSRDGSYSWAMQISGPSTNQGYGVEALADGSFLVTGYFYGTATIGGVTLTSGTSGGAEGDMFLAKFTAANTLSWVKQTRSLQPPDIYVRPASLCYSQDVEAFGDGSSIVVGYFTDTTSFGSTTAFNLKVPNPGSSNGYIIKYNPDGSASWVRQVTSYDPGRLLGVSLLADGSSLVTGYIPSGLLGDIRISSAGLGDVVIAKLSSNGSFVWAQTAGGVSNDVGEDIIALEDGSSVVVGSFQSSAAFGNLQLISAGLADGFIAKVSANGSFNWVTRVGGSLDDKVSSVIKLLDGSLIVAGSFSGTAQFGSFSLASAGSADVFIAKLTATGDFAWVAKAGGAYHDAISGITALEYGSILVSGSFGGSAQFGSNTIVSSGGANSFVAKLNADGSWGGPNQINGTNQNDAINGTSYSELIQGLDGDDSLHGDAADDVLLGGMGNDTLNGGAGTDALNGGEGNDIYEMDGSIDVILDNSGTDAIRSSVAFSLIPFGVIENLTLTGSSAINGTGNGLNNLLIGNAAANVLTGGLGDDTYVVGSGDTVVEGLNEGTDTVQSSLTHTLGANVENLTLTGSSAINGTGNGLNNVLSGNAAANVLTGGLGNDTYVVGSGDTVVEGLNEGTDTVQSSLTYTLGANVENLSLTGSSAINGTGNGLNNVLSGNAAANVLTGGLGDDTYVVGSGDTVVEGLNEGTDTVQSSLTYTLGANVENLSLTGSSAINGTGNGLNNVLSGNAAANVLTGGLGDDTYVVGSGDTVVEGLNEGTDTVQSSLTHTLGANVENLTLTGSNAINGTGNGLNNLLIGNAAANVLTGGLGDDTYVVGSGDTVVEGLNEGTDTVQSSLTYTLGANVENLTLTGSSAINGTGNGLKNVLSGNAAANVLTGGLGNDTYVVGSGDTVVEGLNEGTDTVQSSLTHTLGANVENLTLTGSSAINGTGNGLNNVLSGNAAANVLTGGLGNDTYVVGSGDTVVEGLNEGTDTVQSSLTYTLGANVENLSLTGSSAINGTGNGLNNVLSGNAAANVLTGGLGDDTYVVGSGDTVVEGLNEGTDTVQSSLTYTLGANVENLSLTGSSAINGTGNGLNNVLSGNAAANVLIGGLGDDTYVVGSGDTVVEGLNEGTDTVQSSLTYTLGANVENLTLTGSSAINGTGNGLKNVLSGNAAANVLTGGLGNDTYVVGSGDTVVEGLNEGTDTVQSALTYTLGANVENLTLTGSSAINGTGNGLNNLLSGNAAANVLAGGLGNDTYVVGSGDTVVEGLNEGTDTVQSSLTYTLGANVENLTLTGSNAINGTGNGLNNVLSGNAAANVLTGGLGNDTYVVGSGDTVVEGLNEGTDTVQSALTYTLGANVENLTLTGSSAINGTGNGLNNLLSGNAAANVLAGGLGNDTYVVGSGDTVVEGLNEGTDTVQSSLTYTLGANVENLTLTGSNAINGTGNGLNNVLSGNAAANVLTGGLGNDTINGGGGTDTLTGEGGSDIYRFSSALNDLTNVDLIADFSSADQDRIQLENTGTGLFNGITEIGALASSAFIVGSAFTTASQRIRYDFATGSLFYDADGSNGSASAILFAALTSGLSMANTDFVVT